MPIDDKAVERIRGIMKARGVEWEEKRMFGGICFMVDGKMCFGSNGTGIIARVGPEKAEALIQQQQGAKQMVHNGKPFVGYLAVPDAAGGDAPKLEFWIDKCLEYNPQAKASKKR